MLILLWILLLLLDNVVANEYADVDGMAVDKLDDDKGIIMSLGGLVGVVAVAVVVVVDVVAVALFVVADIEKNGADKRCWRGDSTLLSLLFGRLPSDFLRLLLPSPFRFLNVPSAFRFNVEFQ